MKWFSIKRYIESRSKGGFTKGIGIILLFIVFIIFTPFIEQLEYHKGRLKEYIDGHPLGIFLENNNWEYDVYLKKDKQKLIKVLQPSKQIEIWTKIKKNEVKQIKVDGKMIIEYNWWWEIKTPVFFIIVVLLILPFLKKQQEEENVEINKKKQH